MGSHSTRPEKRASSLPVPAQRLIACPPWTDASLAGLELGSLAVSRLVFLGLCALPCARIHLNGPQSKGTHLDIRTDIIHAPLTPAPNPSLLDYRHRQQRASKSRYTCSSIPEAIEPSQQPKTTTSVAIPSSGGAQLPLLSTSCYLGLAVSIPFLTSPLL